MSRLAMLLILSLTSSATSQDKKSPGKKEVPKLFYAVPLVAKPGEKQKLVLRGKNLAAVKDVKVVGAADAGVKVLGAKMAGVPNNYPAERIGDSEVEIELELPRSVKPGEVKLTAISPGGESNAYTLLVRDDTPAVVEKEPNDGFDQAQTIPVPVAIEGTIKNEKDVDVFQFTGKKGDKMQIEVQAARFGSPVDAMIVLYDAGKRVVDSAGGTDSHPDPILFVRLPSDGAYHLSVMDAHDLGGPNFGYRLVVRSVK